MDVDFDPDKDAANVTKHGVSLAAAQDLDLQFAEVDPRFTHETRWRGVGMIDGLPYFLAFVVTPSGLRAISLRRAHLREYLAYASP